MTQGKKANSRFSQGQVHFAVSHQWRRATALSSQRAVSSGESRVLCWLLLLVNLVALPQQESPLQPGVERGRDRGATGMGSAGTGVLQGWGSAGRGSGETGGATGMGSAGTGEPQGWGLQGRGSHKNGEVCRDGAPAEVGVCREGVWRDGESHREGVCRDAGAAGTGGSQGRGPWVLRQLPPEGEDSEAGTTCSSLFSRICVQCTSAWISKGSAGLVFCCSRWLPASVPGSRGEGDEEGGDDGEEGSRK